MGFVQVIRSPHAHAAIEGIDAAAALAVPGVLGVFSAQDLHADGVGPLPCTTKVSTVEPMRVPDHFALAADRVRYVGEPVAFVVAESRAAAIDAVEGVDVRYAPLPCIVDPLQAMAPGAPQLWDDVPGNVSFRFQKGDQAAVQAAFASAAHVVELELVNNRLIIAPLEHRAAIGDYDSATEIFHLLLSGQGVHGIRQPLADTVFRVPPERIQVSCPDVGGGFGVKNGLYPEYVLVLWAARRLGRPVKWVSGSISTSAM